MMILVETLTACKLFIVSLQLWEASSVLALNLSTCFRYRGVWEGFLLAVGSTNHRLAPREQRARGLSSVFRGIAIERGTDWGVAMA